jgi:fructosamine-3-kinase
MTLTDQLAQAIGAATGEPMRAARASAVGGGCINQALRLTDDDRQFFVKLNEAGRHAMFEAEADALRAIAATHTLRVPAPLCTGIADGQAFLAMEWLTLGGGRHNSDAQLGTGLAALHRATQTNFGWRRDNTIGSTPQINTPASDWIVFYGEHRLGYQLQLATDRGAAALVRSGEQLRARLPAFFSNYRPAPSLLHGDLWSGNFSALGDGTPVVFDPASYYGDREADLAMTELFGGFDQNFYAAYRAAWPLDPGYAVRKSLYNLYHILNHGHLFGGGYDRQAEQMIARLLSEAR